MNFNEASQHYHILLVQKNHNRISEEEFDAQVKQIKVIDQAGVLWTMYGDPAQWFRQEGEKWVADWPKDKMEKSRKPLSLEQKKERSGQIIKMIIIGIVIGVVVGIAGWVLQYNAGWISDELARWAGLTPEFSYFFIRVVFALGLFIGAGLLSWLSGLIFIRRKKVGNPPPLIS